MRFRSPFLEEGEGGVDVEPGLAEVGLDVLDEGRRRDAPPLRHPLRHRRRRRRHEREREGERAKRRWRAQRDKTDGIWTDIIFIFVFIFRFEFEFKYEMCQLC